ncbi:CshA/CshB family fibrillar adhesin-related protein [Erythrobacter sp. R86502]|uniref:CshA/CshB family fibrillar adhesin-related protein n=1 Tax=Erythrobacter sp. R86502 TaxID=3093846 RepID=UPI0036D408D5
MASYARGMNACWFSLRRVLTLVVLLCGLMWSPAAQAQSCGQATTQGTAPDSWQTYCWLNLTNYNDTTARSASGQNLTFTLPDGSTVRLNARVTSTAATGYNAVASPSWTGAAIGNTAFNGIPGRPVLYTASAGTSTITFSNIAVSPPSGASATVYSFVVADAESTNENELLRMSTNGGSWQLLDSVGPIVGTNFPPITGVGTNTVNVGGRSGTVGAYIIASNSPTTVSVQTQAGGLQGVMFAIRFATIRLEASINGARLNTADQFSFQIANTNTGGTIISGTTSGTGTGPFSTPPLALSAGVPITLRESMAPGSASNLSQYATTLTCVNTAGPTRANLPNNQVTTSASIGQLEFGEYLVCSFTNGAQPQLRLRKLLGTFGRRFTGDQFTIRIRDGETVFAARTTTGTSATIINGDTGLLQTVAGTAYTLDEIAAGTTNLENYTATLGCTNAATGSNTVLPTNVGGEIILKPGDAVTCTIRNTRRTTAVLVVEKTSIIISDPINGTQNPKAVPGAIIEYAISVRNVGARRVDSSSIVIVDVMPANMAFATGTPVTFTNGANPSGLNAFNPSTMVRFSSAANGTDPYTYSPVGTFDANVRGIRIAPTGTMSAASSTAQPSFTIRFRAQVQ